MSDKSRTMETIIDLWRGDIKKTINEALEKSPEDKLDWMPAKEMIPLGLIFLHISEASDWWYNEVIMGNESVELAFMDKPCPSKEIIRGHIQVHWDRMERFFADPAEVFDKVYSFKGRSGTVSNSGYDIFIHLFEHDIHHRSQINHYLRIMGIEPPQI